MPTLIVVNSPKDWPFDIPEVDVVDAWSYLTLPRYSDARGVKVLNLCRSYKYQTTGYYVSLLAEARGHKPLPSLRTLQDLKSQSMVRVVSDELDELIQKSLQPLQSEEFTLSVYFGRNMAQRYERLSLQLFNLFQAPLLQFKFAYHKKWQLRSVRAIPAGEVPESHRPFVAESAAKHFSGRTVSRPKRAHTRYDLAILWDPQERENAPSDEAALRKFSRAALSCGLATELITKDDYGRISEFDALFIRETTFVNHHTYRFARRAASEGLVVIDDPQSILRCSNKVFMTELLTRHKVLIPRTVVLHRENMRGISEQLGFPCVIKKPDSSFSQGVVKIESQEMLDLVVPEFLGESELLVAQEYLPTEFDWRIGVLDRRPLYAAKYFMAPGHWQIIDQDDHGKGRYGKSQTIPVELAPRKAVTAAVKAANLIGDGLYGVDVKQSGGKFYIIEVNDNPNIDAGCEDLVLRDELYRRIMELFVSRIERRKAWLPAEQQSAG
jgi:glutathione synthase/RimK-type ligase-like ATP-grasp enzyme